MSQTIFSKLSSLPEFLTSHQLVELGLFTSVDATYTARIRNNSPNFIKLQRKILYPKNSVIEFIECRLKKGNLDQMDNNNNQQGNC